MELSILKSTKKIIGLDATYTAFDHDIITFINGAFSTLEQIGVGPNSGFAIEDDLAVWTDFVEDTAQLGGVKTYVFLKTRLMFDPPTTSYLLDAYKEQIQELEWRLNTRRETTEWIDPAPTLPDSDNMWPGADGGWL